MPQKKPELEEMLRAWGASRRGVPIEDRDVEGLRARRRRRRKSARRWRIVAGATALAALAAVGLLGLRLTAAPTTDGDSAEWGIALGPEALDPSPRPRPTAEELRPEPGQTLRVDAPTPMKATPVYLVDGVRFATPGAFELRALTDGVFELRAIDAPLELIASKVVVTPNETLRIEAGRARRAKPDAPDRPEGDGAEAPPTSTDVDRRGSLPGPSGAKAPSTKPSRTPGGEAPGSRPQLEDAEGDTAAGAPEAVGKTAETAGSLGSSEGELDTVDALELQALEASRRGAHAVAVARFRAALEQASGRRRGSIAFGLGRALFAQARAPEASEAFEDAVEALDPSGALWAEAHIRWAEAELARGRSSRAAVILEALLEARPSSSAAARAEELLQSLRVSPP